MADPAIEAAQRAWVANEALDGIAYCPGEGGLWTPDAMEAAAREALKPIRELHRLVTVPDGGRVCHSCWNSFGEYMRWPCPTAQLIYTTEELAQ